MENEDKTEVCPNCKRDVATANFDLHMAHCERNIILCQLCNEPVPVTEKDHMKIKHARVSCSDCGDNMERWQLDGPHKKTCSKRSEACQYCEMELAFDLLQEHLRYCGARTEQCPTCKKHVLIKNKENHVREECTKRLVTCTYCQLEYPFSEHRTHVKFCIVNLEPRGQEITVGTTKGSHPEKLRNTEVTCSQGDAMLCTDKLQEHVTVSYKCAFCDASVPSNKFRAHSEACAKNARRFNQFPEHNKALKSFECDDFTSSDDKNQATKLKPSGDHLQAAKIHNELLRENPNSADKKCGVDNIPCKFCGHQFGTLIGLQEHLKQCHCEKCVCGEYVLYEELSKHVKSCPKRMTSCKVCSRKCPVSEYGNHLKSCPMSVVTCEFCDEDLLRTELESHSCTKDNRMKSNSRRSQQINDSVANRLEKNKLEDQKTESCPFCKRHFPIILFKKHVQSCFMSTVKCIHCSKTFPVDEADNHLCSVLSKRNRMKSEGQKLNFPDRVFVDPMEGRELSSGGLKYKENNQVVQSTNVHSVYKEGTEDNTEYHLHPGNLDRGAGDDQLHLCPSRHTQMSARVSIQNQSGASGKYQSEVCKFCTHTFDPEELKEHLVQCDERYVTCATCRASVKFRELERHKQLCSKKLECCQFCNKSYPRSGFIEHFQLCPMSPVTCKYCEKVFYRDEIEDHLCSADSRKYNRKQGSSRNLKHSNNRESKEYSKHFQMCQQNTETNQSSDQPMEVDEENTEAKSALEGNRQAEAFSFGTKEMASYSSGGEVVADGLKRNEVFFKCKICDRKTPMQNISVSMFKESETSVCMKCVRNLQELKIDVGNTFSSASCPPTEDASRGADAAEKKKRPEQEVKQCEFCEVYVPLDAWAGHNQSCKSRPLECSKCENLVLLSDVEAHDRICNGEKLEESYSGAQGGSAVNSSKKKAATGSDQAVTCQYCYEKQTYPIKAHEKICGRRFKNCKKCNRSVQLCNMKYPCESGHRDEQESSSPGDASQCGNAAKMKKGLDKEVKQCEFCESYLQLDIWDWHTRTCEQRPCECHRCGALVILGDRDAHDQICNGTILHERYSGAQGDSCVNSAVKKQVPSVAQVEKRTCQYCNGIPRSPLKAHEKDCGISYGTCEKCGLRVQLRYMENPCENSHREMPESVSPPGYAYRVTTNSVEEKENSENEKKQFDINSQKQCDDCGKTVPYAEIGDHKKTCEMRMEKCLFCEKPLLHCQKQQHITLYCQGSPSARGIGRGQQTKEENRSKQPKKQEGKKSPEENRSKQPKKQEGKKGPWSTFAGLVGKGRSRSSRSPQGRNDLHHQDSDNRYSSAYHGNIRQPESVTDLPCEFCGKMCRDDELIIHESGCRPDLFTGPSEDDAEGHFRPQNRRHTDADDDSVPPNRSRRNNDNFQRNLNLRQEHGYVQVPQSRNRANVFSSHPLDSDEELNDVRFSQRPRSSGDSNVTEINIATGRRNVNNENASRRGTEQPKNTCCKECPHSNWTEVSQNNNSKPNVTQAQLGARARSGSYDDDEEEENFYEASETNVHDFQTKRENTHDRVHCEEEKLPPPDESSTPPGKDYVSFSYVGKGDKRNVNSNNLMEISDSERGQQKYQTNRLHQTAESHDNYNLRCKDQPSRVHSNDRISTIECKISYKAVSAVERGNNSVAFLDREMKQNWGESHAKKNFGSENDVKFSDRHRGLKAGQYDENYVKYDERKFSGEADNMKEPLLQNTEDSVFQQYYGKRSNTMDSKYRSREHEVKDSNENQPHITSKEQGLQGNRSNENPSAASGRNSLNHNDQRGSSRYGSRGRNKGPETVGNSNARGNRNANKNTESKPYWR